ncbi:MAG: cell division protein PerM, partial [Nocardioidaceae bacterium]
MTDLLSRPVLRVASADRGPRHSLLLTALVASLWVAVVGLMGCMVLAVAAWFAADTGSFAAATRVGGLAWLVGSGSGLVLDGVDISLVPLGFVVGTGLLLHRAGRWVADRCDVAGGRDAALAIGVMGVAYAAAMEACALVVRTEAASISLLRVGVVGLALAVVAGGSGVMRASGLLGAGMGRLPEDVRGALVGGLAGLAVMVGAASVLLAVSLVVHFSEAVELAEGLGAGNVGGLVVAVVGMALVPNAVLCAGAFLAGPGFVVGTGTMVAPGQVELGPLPAFPLLAALPQAAEGWWVDLVVVV